MTKMVAFLADRLSSAHVDISCEYSPVRLKSQRRGIATVDGEEVEFVIVQREQDLYGLRLDQVIELRSAYTNRDLILLHRIAATRMLTR